MHLTIGLGEALSIIGALLSSSMLVMGSGLKIAAAIRDTMKEHDFRLRELERDTTKLMDAVFKERET